MTSSAVNQPPVITSGPSFAANVGDRYTYQVTAADPDGDPVSFALLAGPAGMTIDAASGLLEWTPTAVQAGRWLVTVAAADNQGGVGTQTFNLTAGINHLPLITSAAVTLVTANAAYRYDVKASDSDGDGLIYTLTNGPAGMTIDSLGA